MFISLTFVGWLATRWSMLTDKGEIKEDAALHFGYSLVPYIEHNKMEQLLTVSYSDYQSKLTFLYNQAQIVITVQLQVYLY